MKRLLSCLLPVIALSMPVSTVWSAQPDNAPGSAAATAGNAEDRYGLRESRELVVALPEVKAWQEKVNASASKAAAGGPPGGILTALKRIDGVKHWSVTLYENPQVDAKRWAVFLVRARDGRIFVQTDDGRIITLEAWRKARPAV